MKIRAQDCLTAVLAVGLLLSLSACKGGHKDEHAHGDAHHQHHHDPPHGGTGVTLGDEAFHLEFLRDPATGRMKAWILTAHMAGYARIKAETFELKAKVGGEEKVLVFQAQASPATGETVGNTSYFEAEADWLKTTDTFDAVLPQIDIKGSLFTGVTFNFPKGN